MMASSHLTMIIPNTSNALSIIPTYNIFIILVALSYVVSPQTIIYSSSSSILGAK